MAEIGSAWFELDARDDKLRAALRGADQRIVQSGKSAERGFFGATTAGLNRLSEGVSSAVATVARTAARITAIAAALGATFAGFALRGAAQMETFTAQWQVLLGSTEAATARMNELRQFARTTPFEIPEVIAASRQLQIFGGTVLATGDNLELVGDIAAGVGRPFEEVATTVGRLYDAIKNGQPFGEAAMRLQEMGAISGESRRDIEELAAAVADGSLTMEEAWAGVSGEFGAFAGLMERQSQTLEGQWSNLQDALGQGAARIGESILPIAKEVLPQVIAGVETLASWVTDTMVPAIGGWVAENEALLNDLRELGGGLLQGIADVAGHLAEAAGNVAMAIGGWVRENGPLLDQIRQLVADVIISGIQRVIELLIAIGSEPVMLGIAGAVAALWAVHAVLDVISKHPVVAALTGIVVAFGVLEQTSGWLAEEMMKDSDAIGWSMTNLFVNTVWPQIITTVDSFGKLVDAVNWFKAQAVLVLSQAALAFIDMGLRIAGVAAAFGLDTSGMVEALTALKEGATDAAVTAERDLRELGESNPLEALADDMRAEQQRVAAAMEALQAEVVAREERMRESGRRMGSNWGNAMVETIKSYQGSVGEAAARAMAPVMAFSPPKVGPLREIGTWAENLASYWSERFTGSLRAASGSVQSALSTVAPRPAMAAQVGAQLAMQGVGPASGAMRFEGVIRIEDPHHGLAAAKIDIRQLSREIAEHLRMGMVR